VQPSFGKATLALNWNFSTADLKFNFYGPQPLHAATNEPNEELWVLNPLVRPEIPTGVLV
jgi:hypothetical protein